MDPNVDQNVDPNVDPNGHIGHEEKHLPNALQGGDKLKGAKAVDMNTVPGSWFNITEQMWTRGSRKFSMAGVPHHYNNYYNQQQPDFV